MSSLARTLQKRIMARKGYVKVPVGTFDPDPAKPAIRLIGSRWPLLPNDAAYMVLGNGVVPLDADTLTALAENPRGWALAA